jgi:hypothetical protein
VSIDFVAFLQARKKPIADGKENAPFVDCLSDFFSAQVKAATQVHLVQIHRIFSAKKSKEKVSRANNFLVFVDDSYDADNTRQLCLKKRISYAILISVIIRFNSINIYF